MLVLGLIALVLGYLLSIGILITIGWILIAIGAILLVLGVAGREVAGRRYWF